MAACMRGWASILLWKVGLKCHFNSTLFGGTVERQSPKRPLEIGVYPQKDNSPKRPLEK